MAINCEYGAFDNEHKVLPLTPYDIIIDRDSPRPGQQAFEKMTGGLYLGEIFRLVLVALHENPDVSIFDGQSIDKLKKPYSLDSSFLSAIEECVFGIHFTLSRASGVLTGTLPLSAIINNHETQYNTIIYTYTFTEANENTETPSRI